MAAAFLYVAVALILLVVCDRAIARISRRAALILTILPLLFTGRALLTGRVYSPADLLFSYDPFKEIGPQVGVHKPVNGWLADIFSQIIPWQEAVRHSLRQGEWPLWNPFVLSGDVLAASAQSAPYYPFHLIGLLLPLDLAVTYQASITILVSALGAFLFFRELECDEDAALVGAAAWAFSAVFVFWTEWPLGVSTQLLPLVMLGTRRIVRRTDVASVILLATALTLLVLAGHPESVVHVVGIASIYGLYEIFRAARNRFVSVVAAALGAGIVSIGLSAVFLFPIVEAIPQTEEREIRDMIGKHFSLAVPWPKAFQQARKNVIGFDRGLPQDERPTYAGEELPRAYPGSIVLALAIVGVISRRTDRWFMLGLVIFGILAGASAPFPFVILEKVPVVRLALNDRLVIAASLGLAALAAFGVEALRARRRRSMAGAFLAVSVVLAMMVASIWPELIPALTPENLELHTVLLVAPPVIAALVVLLARGHLAVQIIFILLLMQRVVEERGMYAVIDRQAFYPPPHQLRSLPKTDEPYRFVSQGHTFPSNVSTMYGLEDVRGYQAMTHSARRATYVLWSTPQAIAFNRVDDLTRPFLSFLNVRFALALPDQPVPDGWKAITDGPGMRLLENTRVLPRSFIPRTVRLGSSKDDLLDMVHQRDFAERSWVTASRTGPDRDDRDVVNGTGTLQLRRRGSTHHISAHMNEPAWVVISETAWKGWRASIDGRSTPVFIANHAFLGIHVPKGNHEVVLRYLPDSFVWGRRVTGVTAAVCFGLLLVRYFVSKRRETRTTASATVYSSSGPSSSSH